MSLTIDGRNSGPDGLMGSPNDDFFNGVDGGQPDPSQHSHSQDTIVTGFTGGSIDTIPKRTAEKPPEVREAAGRTLGTVAVRTTREPQHVQEYGQSVQHFRTHYGSNLPL